MLHYRVILSALLAAGLFVACPLSLRAQTDPPVPVATTAPVPTSAPVASPAPLGSPPPVSPSPVPASPVSPGPQATAVPISAEPQSASVAVGGSTQVHLYGIFGDASITVANPQLVDAAVDQGTRMVLITGKAVGQTVLTVKDSRGVTRDVPVRIAYNAGTFAEGAVVHITGNPASADFLREIAAATT
ncbi:MAG: pilus assembly protein N-terminal domain-containing protein, partial [Candidatus Eremiobacteraeota bacterium]|nr:pilus assembly protein N-terminal domain-containing protein [Candidatus Eremiobacteraeota bacterium]